MNNSLLRENNCKKVEEFLSEIERYIKNLSAFHMFPKKLSVYICHQCTEMKNIISNWETYPSAFYEPPKKIG